MDFNKDYYGILGVESSASKEVMKGAYRRLVKEHHPDRNPGDVNAEERIKEINEAYDLLFNDLTRYSYDAFRREKAESKKSEEEEQKRETAADVGENNKRTIVRTHTVHKEKRTYLKGIITVKFWGELLQEEGLPTEKEISYRVHPTDVTVRISQSDIHSLDTAPPHFQQSYKESDLFTTPLPQPLACIIQTATGEEHYTLELKDIRVKAPTIVNVTKHESESFGTLTGELYAFVNEFVKEEYELQETECFGPSGHVEFKEEEGQLYMRKEHFNLDCTRAWGPWERVQLPQSGRTVGGTTTGFKTRASNRFSGTTKERKAPASAPISELAGCLNYWWVLPVLLLAIRFPLLGAGIGIMAALHALFYLLSFLINRVRLLTAVLALLFLAAMVFTFINSRKNPVSLPHDTAMYDSVSTTQSVVKKKTSMKGEEVTDTTQETKSQDTVINHFVRWRDYDSTAYEANLSVSLSELRSSVAAHHQLKDYPVSGWTAIYHYLEREDQSKLRFIYSAFDSIRQKRGLDEKGFASMVVSCVQSLPYFLVLDHSCNAASYSDDEFVSNYLQACDRDCCIGNVAFGIASPVEFIGNLKGDCDTRALLLYMLLKEFRYNVALLTSDYYKHAVIAVSFAGAQPEGLTMNIGNKNFYLWETTSAGLKPGIVAPAMQNLKFWNVSLLNKID